MATSSSTSAGSYLALPSSSSSTSFSPPVPSSSKLIPRVFRESTGHALIRISIVHDPRCHSLRTLCALNGTSRHFRDLTCSPRRLSEESVRAFRTVSGDPLWEPTLRPLLSSPQTLWVSHIPHTRIPTLWGPSMPFLRTEDLAPLRKRHSVLAVQDLTTIGPGYPHVITRGAALVVFVNDQSHVATHDTAGNRLRVRESAADRVHAYVFAQNDLLYLYATRTGELHFNYVTTAAGSIAPDVGPLRNTVAYLRDLIAGRLVAKHISANENEAIPPIFFPRSFFCCSSKPIQILSLQVPESAVILPPLPAAAPAPPPAPPPPAADRA